MKKRIVRIIKWSGIIVFVLIVMGLCFPTWTQKIANKNSISELRKVEVNGTALEIMIRGNNIENPVVIFVHGGPCCSEIPYVRKYQDLLEKDFTIVHYDQRGSGKSYRFGKDYSDVDAAIHVSDLVALTEYVEKYLNQNKVILVGHSYGTYIATQAAAKKPDLYLAYVGIGQMSDSIESEMDGLQKCMTAARAAGNTEDSIYLNGLEKSVKRGERITPRSYVRKYGFAARNINETQDYLKGFILGSEYNLLDIIGFHVAFSTYQDSLIMEALQNSISDIVTEINIPVYFLMGKYDCMTSPEAAEKYLNNLKGIGTRELVIFKNSAHYPQFEEKGKFYQWMCDTFKKGA